jgi:hypothetical protein
MLFTGKMLDIQLLRTNLDAVAERLATRGYALDTEKPSRSSKPSASVAGAHAGPAGEPQQRCPNRSAC